MRIAPKRKALLDCCALDSLQTSKYGIHTMETTEDEIRVMNLHAVESERVFGPAPVYDCWGVIHLSIHSYLRMMLACMHV